MWLGGCVIVLPSTSDRRDHGCHEARKKLILHPLERFVLTQVAEITEYKPEVYEFFAFFFGLTTGRSRPKGA